MTSRAVIRPRATLGEARASRPASTAAWTSAAARVGVAVMVGLAVAGCTAGAEPVGPGGAVPVATPPPRVLTPPTGRPGQVALVAMGSTVRGEGLADGTVALVSAHGPVLEAQGRGVADRSAGTVTLLVTGATGTATLVAADLLSRDDSGNPVTLEVAPATVTVGPGEHATVTVHGTWEAGRAYLAWLVGGRPVATWTFDVELD